MLKAILNEMRWTLEITTTGPLLVRSGQATAHGPDMTPVRTWRGGDWQVYIPGSSLKGVIRSHAEKVVHTLHAGIACDPFLRMNDARRNGRPLAEVSCGDKFEQRDKQLRDTISSETAYADACPICRTFGSTEFIGRLNIGDAYLVNPAQGNVREQRDGVGIDRLTGGAAIGSGAKFELEAVPSQTVFRAEGLLRNFECWQVGLLLGVVRDMQDGLVAIGGGRSRGFGAVTASLPALALFHTRTGATHRPAEVWGLGRYLHDPSIAISQQDHYGTEPDDLLTLDPAPVWEPVGLRRRAAIDASRQPALTEASVQALVRRIEAWQPPESMSASRFADPAGGGRQ